MTVSYSSHSWINQDQITDLGAANHQRHSWRSGSKHDKPLSGVGKIRNWWHKCGRPGSLGSYSSLSLWWRTEHYREKKDSIKGWKGRSQWEVEIASERKDGSPSFPVDTSFHELQFVPMIGFVFPETGSCTLTTNLLFLKLAWVSLATKYILAERNSLSWICTEFLPQQEKSKSQSQVTDSIPLRSLKDHLTVSQFGALIPMSLIFNDVVVFNNFYNLLNIKSYEG